MATVAVQTPARKTPRAFYATLYNGELHGVLTQVHGQISFFADDGQILDYEPTMAPWLTLLGECSLTETARILDRVAGGAAQIACDRQMMEVA
jgi:hypothetical protein